MTNSAMFNIIMIKNIQHSEIHSVMSLDFDFGCLLLPESQVCAYGSVFIEQSGTAVIPPYPRGYVPRPPVNA